MNGILLIDKPEGLTSAEVVRRVKKRWGVRVGHLGTLDPFATGVLPLCLGDATRLAQFLNVLDKRYVGRVRLGTATDTGDRTGRALREAPVPPFDETRLREVERRFTGLIAQIPPMYSALKKDGVPLYKLARRGVEVQREVRQVTIHSLELNRVGDAELSLEVACSKGTYVRVLAEDIGRALGTEAHLSELRRTRFGAFDVAEALRLDADLPSDLPLIAAERALAHLPAVSVSERDADHVRHGRTNFIARLDLPAGAEAVALVQSSGSIVAVLTRTEAGWAIGRVLSKTPH